MNTSTVFSQSQPDTDGGFDSTRMAYLGGASIAMERMECEAPLDAEALAAIVASDIVVVPGCYDHVERVLGALEVPYTTVVPGSLTEVDLRPEQLLVVNCPGGLTPAEIIKVRDFVAAGGNLFTTDWALQNVIEPAFPGYVEYNDNPTGDDVVGIEVVDADSPYLKGVLDGEDDPQWWLEGSSYPIRVLDSERVRVLIRSGELGEKYGECAVAVVFEFGRGEVFHMISHYYLQRTELRSERHNMSAADYADEKGVMFSAAMSETLNDVSLGEVEAAATSARLFANIIATKKQRQSDS
ncbi:MAG: hypothetical protein HOA26_00045 [Actinobacteria bacterium]|jgi:hypothetical protein|nr:hypothetical protein [Actinomycetota bacterium]MBT3686721.1 hypothetical protein [Actinomycetota bacterium]MBT6064271.1 hypothetical protein [Actinomycetota bacterium]MBT6871618.1 hypothetical protein [Actinomycetota bacterium]